MLFLAILFKRVQFRPTGGSLLLRWSVLPPSGGRKWWQFERKSEYYWSGRRFGAMKSSNSLAQCSRKEEEDGGARNGPRHCCTAGYFVRNEWNVAALCGSAGLRAIEILHSCCDVSLRVQFLWLCHRKLLQLLFTFLS